jgi:hypothetical protein
MFFLMRALTFGLRRLSDASINWSDLDVLSDAGINWADLDILI